MNCYIYRCSRKQDLYIYITEKDDFSCVPADIMRSLGIIEFALELELTADSKLARENVSKVMKNLHAKGFHLQLPGDTTVESMMSKIANSKP